MANKTTGVLIVVHGGYGRAMVDAAEAIVGPLEVGITTICVEAGASLVERCVARDMERLDQGQGVLVLTDLCGSTPSNACNRLAGLHPRSAVLTGLNLPMLIKLSTCERTLEPRQLAEQLYETSRRSITLRGDA